MMEKPDKNRMTISFTQPTLNDMKWLAEHRHEKHTDSVNRSVRIRTIIEKEIEKGRVMYFGDEDGSNLERIRLV